MSKGVKLLGIVVIGVQLVPEADSIPIALSPDMGDQATNVAMNFPFPQASPAQSNPPDRSEESIAGLGSGIDTLLHELPASSDISAFVASPSFAPYGNKTIVPELEIAIVGQVALSGSKPLECMPASGGGMGYLVTESALGGITSTVGTPCHGTISRPSSPIADDSAPHETH
jgi:hypothetical protein